MESSKFNMSSSSAPEMLSYTRGRYRIIGGKYKKRAFLLGMCFLGCGCQLQQTETFIFKHGFLFHSEICISGYLRVDCMEWSHWTSGGGGGMDHMSADFTPWSLLFQGSGCLFHGHLRVTFSAGSDLYSYLPSVANELCAPGQVTNLSEPQFSYLHHRENNENVQGCFEDCCCLGAKLCLTVLWPRELWPTRSLCPWDFPDKKTGVSVISFSRESSRPRDQTHVSHIAGGLCHCRQILHLLSYQGSPFWRLDEVKSIKHSLSILSCS